MILGIDVGGTHTDAVLIDGHTVIKKVKVVTDQDDLASSLLEVTEALLGNSALDDLERVVLSTTISTNAIVQNHVSAVGMILASGPGLAPTMLTVNENTHFVSGYVNHRGIPVAPIDRNEVEHICARLTQDSIDHLGVVGKFSTRDPQIELDIENVVGSRFTHISLGHQMSGNLDFPRRIATTYLNAAIWDLYGEFVKIITTFANRFHADFPIFILKADGGTYEISQSAKFPVQTILSGPAASIMGILGLTDCKEDAIALDIGGTTTDIAVFANGAPLLEPLGVTIGGRKTLIRGLRTKPIGLGGDSRVRYKNGSYIIGPERCGPAAAFGGPCATPTDAMIVLNLTEIGNREKALDAIANLAEEANCPVQQAAQDIFDLACRQIASSVQKMIDTINNRPVYTIHELLEGKTLQPTILHVVGGPAKPMAPRLGELLNCPVHTPEHAEVANAVGAALARTTTELTVLADTEKKTLTVVEEGTNTPISKGFTRSDAIMLCTEKLKARATAMGATKDDLDIEITEDQMFNMVRGYHTAGQNIRIKAQIKPGLISTFRKGKI